VSQIRTVPQSSHGQACQPEASARLHERWYGEYPSMYLSTGGLIGQVRAHLGE
jgi:hypothetical protein